ncbi:MAG TPA: DUF2800 domain-containing protein [Ruminococcus sp.]|nr:DUF2800 domain-containing protein [Ruminococcus sp.]
MANKSTAKVSGVPPNNIDHANRAHAILSASATKRWLNCPPSARLNEQFPNTTSEYAEEGTAAHELCEYKVRKYLHDRMERPQSDYYTEEIEQATDIYVEFVIGIIEEMKVNGCEPMALVEEKLDYSHIAPSGFGTGDMIVIGKDAEGRGLLHIVDYKNGKGVFVDADHNPQMMLYALGALRAYDFIYDVEIVRMSIVQPRLENISTCEMPVSELKAWAESIKPIAKLAYEGKGEQKPGDWCRFCRAKPVCKACADEALALCHEDFLDLDAGAFDTAEESDMTAPYEADTQTAVFKQPGLIPISELAKILPTLNRISSWIEAVFAFVSSEAINHGVPIPGYKVVEGRSKRVFTDTKAVVDTAVQNGYTDLYKQTLITLTEFEKMMGKKKFNELLGAYVTKPPGKLALVPESDPREPVDLISAPEQEFSILPDED